jgi:hypothetical protein
MNTLSSTQITQEKQKLGKYLFEMMNMIDAVCDDERLKTGEYVTICDLMKKLHELKFVVVQNVVYTRLVRNRERRIPNQTWRGWSHAQKLAHGFLRCYKCGRYIKNSGMKKHQERDICEHIDMEKVISKWTQKNTNLFSKVKENDIGGEATLKSLEDNLRRKIEFPLMCYYQPNI